MGPDEAYEAGGVGVPSPGSGFEPWTGSAPLLAAVQGKGLDHG